MAAILTATVTALKISPAPGDAQNLSGAVLMVLAAAALAVRARHTRRYRRRVWGLLALGAAFNAAGETLWTVRDIAGIEQGAVSLGPDLLYLASYPCLLVALWMVVVGVNGPGARATLSDALGFLMVVGFAMWQAFVAYPTGSDETRLDHMILAIYPMLDAMLVAMAVWLLLAIRVRNLPAMLLAAFAAVFFAGDVLYAAHDSLGIGDIRAADTVFCSAFGILIILAVAPGRLVTRRAVVRDDTLWRAAIARAMTIGVTLILGPLTALLSSRADVPTSPFVVGAIVGGASVLVLVRLVMLVHELERAEVTARAAEARLAHIAAHDPLTRLPNRRLLMDRLRMAVAQSRRSDTHVGVLYLDLDGFKGVNDTLGHAAGDAMLVQVAERLAHAVRSGDTVARVGGDEFVVALPGLAAADEADRVAEHVLEHLTHPYVIDGTDVTGGASVGVAVVDGDDVDGTDAIARADAALGRAKRGGRGQVSRA